ncbi:MAG: acyl-CoA thioesterase [Leptospiraceae bacterium]|nr:acyl-CoA thioesterase [Leptospiraceae bacterium]MCK6382455.1 acyl-CoA thioesterase [Leptospiraceae bacterium]
MKFDRVYIYPLVVAFEDIDAGGGVHHPNYLKYLERGRSQGLIDSDYSFGKFMSEGFVFVVAEIISKYLKPAFLEEKLYVVTHFTACKKSSIKIYQSITKSYPKINLSDKEINIFQIPDTIFQAQMRLVCVHLAEKKVIEVPSTLKEALLIPEPDFFEKNPDKKDVRLSWR